MKTSKYIYQIANHPGKLYEINTRVWCGFYLDAVSPWNSIIGSMGAGVLIGQKHLLCAAHIYPKVNTMIRLVDTKGKPADRRVCKTTTHPAWAGNPGLCDLTVVEVSEPFGKLRFHPLPIIRLETLEAYGTRGDSIIGVPPGYTVQFPGEGLPVVAYDVENKALDFRMTHLAVEPGRMVGANTTGLVSAAFWGAPKDTTNYEPAVGGDSGHPLVMRHNGRVVLVSVFSGQAVGSLCGGHLDWIETLVPDLRRA